MIPRSAPKFLMDLWSKELCNAPFKTHLESFEMYLNHDIRENKTKPKGYFEPSNDFKTTEYNKRLD